MEAPAASSATAASAAESAALFALHDRPSVPDSPGVRRATSATELLAALHFVPTAYRGSRWSGSVVLRITRSFSVGITVNGDEAIVSYRTPEGAEPFLTMEADRDTLLSMLEGSATPCMLVVSGAMWVDNWQHALLFQEAFDFDPASYQSWREQQRHVMLRPRHADKPSELAGGVDVDEDVEAAIQTVIRERAHDEVPLDGASSAAPAGPSSYGQVVGSLLCCTARRAAAV